MPPRWRPEGALPELQPFVLQTSLDAASYQLNAYTRQAALYSRIYQNIQDLFNKANAKSMSFHYRVQRNGNQTASPS